MPRGAVPVVVLLRARRSVLLSPLTCRLDGSLLIFLPCFCNLGSEWVVRVGSAEKGLNREENGTNLEGRRPVVCGRQRRLETASSGCTASGLEKKKRRARKTLLFKTSRQIRPSLSTLGWKILVRKRILGGTMG